MRCSFLRLTTVAAAAVVALGAAGCGGAAEPSGESTVAPVAAGARAELKKTAPSRRLSASGWRAMKGYSAVIAEFNRHPRAIDRRKVQQELRTRCLSLAGGDTEQAVAVRRACVDDMALGGALVEVHGCIHIDEHAAFTDDSGPSRRRCQGPAVPSAADAADEAAVSTRAIAQTIKPGACRDIFNGWADENDRMARELAAIGNDLRGLTTTERSRALRDKARAFAAAAPRQSFAAFWRGGRDCRPA